MTAQPGRESFARPAVELDDIMTFCGAMSAEEYELRSRIRACRNAASYKVTQTESDNARQILWIAAETATAAIYAPADLKRLGDVATFLRRLLTVACQAEELEGVA